MYNTLTRKKEPFEPLAPGKVGMYVCGVTVYDQSHLGHAKSAINFDVIARYLRHKGFEVNHVTNFTDVDDKIINRANELGMEPLKLSQSMIDEYHRDMDALRIKRASVYPKASETMPEIISMVKGLIDKGYAYESNSSVYFSVHKAKEYGKLSGQNLDQMVAGARVEVGEDKRDPMDFALWKAAKPGEIAWDSPWGKGRPGWHIECSAMCLKHIGKTVDIHGGGTELVFPHHENEILQSEAYNDAPFVRYWMHNGLLTIDQEKMSKSLKNFFMIKDILKRYSPETVRFYLLNASYRQPLDYDEKSLEETGKALEKLQNAYNEIRIAARSASGANDADRLCLDTWTRFEQSMDDDFSTREAVAVIYEFARDTNKLLNEKALSKKGAENMANVFRKFNSLFEVLKEEIVRQVTVTDSISVQDEVQIHKMDLGTITHEMLSDENMVNRLVQSREAARRKKDFTYADMVRKKLAELGIEILDSKDGPTWKRK